MKKGDWNEPFIRPISLYKIHHHAFLTFDCVTMGNTLKFYFPFNLSTIKFPTSHYKICMVRCMCSTDTTHHTIANLKVPSHAGDHRISTWEQFHAACPKLPQSPCPPFFLFLFVTMATHLKRSHIFLVPNAGSMYNIFINAPSPPMSIPVPASLVGIALAMPILFGSHGKYYLPACQHHL